MTECTAKGIEKGEKGLGGLENRGVGDKDGSHKKPRHWYTFPNQSTSNTLLFVEENFFCFWQTTNSYYYLSSSLNSHTCPDLWTEDR